LEDSNDTYTHVVSLPSEKSFENSSNRQYLANKKYMKQMDSIKSWLLNYNMNMKMNMNLGNNNKKKTSKKKKKKKQKPRRLY